MKCVLIRKILRKIASEEANPLNLTKRKTRLRKRPQFKSTASKWLHGTHPLNLERKIRKLFKHFRAGKSQKYFQFFLWLDYILIQNLAETKAKKEANIINKESK